MFKKILVLLGSVVAVWLISPIPEVSILVSLLGGSFIAGYIPAPRWVVWFSSVVGALIGSYFVKKSGLLRTLKNVVR